MSFETLKTSELKKIAEDFAVDIAGLKNKADIIAALSEEGVTWSVYQKTIKDIEEDMGIMDTSVKPKVEPKKNDENMVLVKMDRANFSYVAMGYKFTSDHPFVAMDKDIAQEIFDKEEGFRLATPREVQEFYS